MDEMKITINDNLTKSALSKLVTRLAKKKLGSESLAIMIKNAQGGLELDDVVIRADVVVCISKAELLEMLKGETS